MSNNVNAILDGLNEQQKKAVECVDGPVLIVAGAGSGKTRVLMSRIAFMLEKGIEPENILALTFTKKAATEMKERVALLVGQKKTTRLCMGTFHSVFVRFLREYAGFLGYPSNFTIYDTSDSESAIKACLKDLHLDATTYRPRTVLSRISKAKNNLISPAAYSRDTTAMTNDRAAKIPRLVEVYSFYVKRCRELGVMDFDDILFNMNVLLRDNPEALESLSQRFTHIMVDEYQDTNFAQYLIIKKLALKNRNICVVGDDSQSIYSFRGAKIENILNFRKDFPESKIFKLEYNYRSTRMIVGAANSLIEKNAGRIPKECKSSSAEEGEKILLVRSSTEDEEAILISEKIQSRIYSDKCQYSEFAILYRTNAQSRALETALRKRNIPYRIFAGTVFYDRMEIKDVMSYLKLVSNTNDDEAFKRIVNKPARGIGDTTIASLEAAAKDIGISLFKACFHESLEMYGLKSAAIQKLRDFCSMIDRYAAMALTEDAYILASGIINASGIYALYKNDSSIEAQAKAANIEELLNSVKSHVEDRDADALTDTDAELLDEVHSSNVTLGDYLEDTSLLSNVDVSKDEEDANNRVTLMTVHTSKGLEFPYVFISGMEENLFPSGSMHASPNEIEEERRLFYVALTRARKAVTLTYSDTRMRNGKREPNRPSRFIRDINPFYLVNPLTGQEHAEEHDYDPIDLAVRNQSLYGRKTSWKPSNRNGSSVKFVPSDNKPSTASGTPSSSSRSSLGSTASVSKPSTETKFLRNQKTGSYIPVTVQKKSEPIVDFVPETDLGSFKKGDRVVHKNFGSGVILDLQRVNNARKVVVGFDKYGQKTLLLEYAKLRHE